VRERWALCAIRGILARYLTVQLPAVSHPEWSHPYQYLDGDKTPFQIQRYPKIQWVSVGDGRLVEPLIDPPPRSSVETRLEGSGESTLTKATWRLKDFVVGMMSD
jgi:hypothetical protein